MAEIITSTELWEKCTTVLKEKLDKETFKTWIIPIVPKQLKNNTLTIEIPNSFFYEWISVHFSRIITEILSKIHGENIKLEYIIKKEESNNNIKITTNHTNAVINKNINFIKKNFIDIDNISCLNTNYTFENFIEGDCNQLAKSSAESVAKKPLNNPFNPLMIYSDVGLGKTHLLHAIGNKIKELDNDKVVVFIPTTVFIDQYINSIRENNPQEFSRFYSSIDILLLDDVQFLKDKIKTQENLFYIFNQLHQLGKQIVLTSDKAPNNLEGLQERLVSRFKWGLTVNINTPDLETKIAILETKFAKNCNISKDVLEYIAQRVNSNIRELEGVMITAIANVSSQHNIDINSIQKIINKISSNDLIVDRISNAVASYFKISIEDILGKSRQKDISLARQISMYFAKKYTKCSLKTIGSLIGGRDHSTVIHAINTIETLMKNEKNMKNMINSINKEINSKTLKTIQQN